MVYYILKSYKLKLKPFNIFETLSKEKNFFFLDSSLTYNSHLGRYSFLGMDPFFVLSTKHPDPFRIIRDVLKAHSIKARDNNIPFLGGAVGYLAYDLGLAMEEKIKTRNKETLDIPDCFFGFYNSIIIIDHAQHRLYICSLGFPEKRHNLAKLLAESNFKKIYALLCKTADMKKAPPRADLLRYFKKNRQVASKAKQLNSNFTKSEYLCAVKKAKRYIQEGDIYQVNLSQHFQAKVSLSSLDIYARLRRISPSYFSAYFDCLDFQIISSSPERFLKLNNGVVTTRPMKGTRPRGKSKIEDRALRRELLDSTKDQAELTMIVDLARNDLGRVCNYDSIRVLKLRELERYSKVFQTTATISGSLHKSKDGVDLLRASFPGGSITGCPKIRAMEIIEELEPSRRAIYTGCLGYLSFSGNMDFNIMIRTILKKGSNVYFGVGGGIVADSSPEAEYQETLVKAEAMLEAIG